MGAVHLESGPNVLRDVPANIASAAAQSEGSSSQDFSLRRSRRRTEIDAIGRALRATGDNRTHAARLLEISHRALLYKIKELRIRD